MNIHYSIAPEIFARFPDFLRGVVIAHDLNNGQSPPELIDELRAAEQALYERLTADSLTSHPQIVSWRAAYRTAGIKPSEFRPSVEALVRRVLKKDPLPTISTLVDIGTLVSIQSLIPVGAHAIDHLTQDISLRLAKGTEVFAPFGSEAIEHPQAGEIIFAEDEVVLTRRWTWRQSKHTLVVPETSAVEINVDCLPPVTLADAQRICEIVMDLLQKYCGGQMIHYQVLSRDHPLIELL